MLTCASVDTDRNNGENSIDSTTRITKRSNQHSKIRLTENNSKAEIRQSSQFSKTKYNLRDINLNTNIKNERFKYAAKRDSSIEHPKPEGSKNLAGLRESCEAVVQNTEPSSIYTSFKREQPSIHASLTDVTKVRKVARSKPNRSINNSILQSK